MGYGYWMVFNAVVLLVNLRVPSLISFIEFNVLSNMQLNTEIRTRSDINEVIVIRHPLTASQPTIRTGAIGLGLKIGMLQLDAFC